jgi:hypothetical protein
MMNWREGRKKEKEKKEDDYRNTEHFIFIPRVPYSSHCCDDSVFVVMVV